MGYNKTPAEYFESNVSDAASMSVNESYHLYPDYFENNLFESNVTNKANVSSNDSDSYYNNYEDDYVYYIATPDVTAIVLVICGFILLVGIVGNIFVMIIIAAVKSMHTTVNKCLFSLALADLVVLCFLPIEPIRADFTDFKAPITAELCNFLNFYDRGACVCSFLIFFYVTIDRYFALCYPLRSRALWSGRKTYVILVLIWSVSLASSYPYVHVSVYEKDIYGNVTNYYCYFNEQSWFVWYDTIFSVAIFYIPVPLFIVLYGRMIHRIRASVPKSEPGTKENNVAGRRGRGQVVILLLIVVAIYSLSQVPFATLIFLHDFFPGVLSLTPYDERVFTITWTCRLLIYVNSAANPVIYFSLSTNFRQGFIQVCSCFRRNTSKSQITQSSSVNRSN